MMEGERYYYATLHLHDWHRNSVLKEADHLPVKSVIALSVASLYLKHGALVLVPRRGLTNCPNSSIPLQSK